MKKNLISNEQIIKKTIRPKINLWTCFIGQELNSPPETLYKDNTPNRKIKVTRNKNTKFMDLSLDNIFNSDLLLSKLYICQFLPINIHFIFKNIFKN